MPTGGNRTVDRPARDRPRVTALRCRITNVQAMVCDPRCLAAVTGDALPRSLPPRSAPASLRAALRGRGRRGITIEARTS